MLISPHTAALIRSVGRQMTIKWPDGTEFADKCLVMPLRYKNKMYMEGVGTRAGAERDGYYEMYAPCGFIPDFGSLEGYVLNDARLGSFSIIRRDTVYDGDEPLYDWVVLLERTGGPFIDVHPVSGSCRDGEVFRLFCHAEGSVSYRWQRKGTSAGAVWTDTSSTTGTYGANMRPYNNGAWYRCRVTDSDGNVSYSRPAIMTMEI